MSEPTIYGQQVPYTIAEISDDLPSYDELLAVVCTGTGIGLVAFMSGFYLHKQSLGYQEIGEISSLSMLSDPIVSEDTGYFESPGVKLRLTDRGDVPILVAFGPRQPASWESHFASKALFDIMNEISDSTMMLSVGGFGVTDKEEMPEIVGRPNGAKADEYMKSHGIAKIDDIQEVEGITKVLNAGQGFQAALPMLAMKSGIPSVFFLGTALMSHHSTTMDVDAVRHVLKKISELSGLGLDFERIEEDLKKETNEQRDQEKVKQKTLYALAKRFAQAGDEGQEGGLPDTNMYI
jgi:proteasome assembly chaperone (PAC2) family protein